jgi:ribonuclease Z
MTFAEAASLARDGGARRLWLTHFGPALSDPCAHLDRATTIFPATSLGHDGLTETLSFE